MENGKLQPTTAKLLGISSIFKVSIDELFIDFLTVKLTQVTIRAKSRNYKQGAIPCTKPIHSQKERRITQVAAANLINISSESYHSKENRELISPKRSSKLAKYFKTTVDELFEK